MLLSSGRGENRNNAIAVVGRVAHYDVIKGDVMSEIVVDVSIYCLCNLLASTAQSSLPSDAANFPLEIINPPQLFRYVARRGNYRNRGNCGAIHLQSLERGKLTEAQSESETGHFHCHPKSPPRFSSSSADVRFC